MSKQCINNNCLKFKSKPMFKATKLVCICYNVNYKPFSWVCRTCMENYKVQRKQLKKQDVNRPYVQLEDQTENEKSNAHKYSSKVTNKQKLRKNNGVIKTIKIPANCPKPIVRGNHQCSSSCMYSYDYRKTKNMNVLSIPLHYAFKRSRAKANIKFEKVTYTTPCGCKISSEQSMYNYLKVTGYGNCGMPIDLFSFDYMVEPLFCFKVPKKFIRNPDITNKMEFKSISVVNSFNDLLPPKEFKYIIECETTPDVNLDMTSNFSCGCNCIDNCEDKTKCSCWQRTYYGPKNNPEMFEDLTSIGYNFKRLLKPVFTGIFECNTHCKCAKTCLNRVVQEPIKSSLQLFFTEKKGWGVRTLADIPKGSFICKFIGVVRMEKDAENNCATNEYIADLDFSRTVAEIKDGYESSYGSEEIKNSSSQDYNPGQPINSNNNIISSGMSLIKSVQDTNTKIDSKHQLSNLDTREKVKSKHNSLQKYINKDVGLYTLDAMVSGNIGRYFNHSCDPNIFIQNVFIDTHDLRFPTVAHFALSNIQAGTELAWNYKYGEESLKSDTLICHCGSINCKDRLS